MDKNYCGRSCEGCKLQTELNCKGCKDGPGGARSDICELASCCKAFGFAAAFFTFTQEI